MYWDRKLDPTCSGDFHGWWYSWNPCKWEACESFNENSCGWYHWWYHNNRNGFRWSRRVACAYNRNNIYRFCSGCATRTWQKRRIYSVWICQGRPWMHHRMRVLRTCMTDPETRMTCKRQKTFTSKKKTYKSYRISFFILSIN